jgi:hypothetical protein
MLQLSLAYLFAAGTSVVVVYLARQNRKQGWKRPSPKWFGVELQNREPAMLSALGAGSDADELMPQILQLNRQLAAHGIPVKPEVESDIGSEAESLETPEHVSIRRS